MNPRILVVLFVFLYLVNLNEVYAQTNSSDMPSSYTLQTVVGPSPNASSLGKYADWPVNLYTGIPQIDVPIYDLKGRSVTIPISLSYHAGGNKVSDIASWVGMGWALQAGGVIMRSIRGQPDEDGYLSMRSYYNNPGDLSSGTTVAQLDSTFWLQVVEGESDSDPDLFMFSALGKSYKFFFLGNGTIVTQPYSNVKITVSSDFSTWTVVLEDGTTLVLGGTGCVERTYWEAGSASTMDGGDFISAWYLQSVTTPTGEKINFTYSTAASGSYSIQNIQYTDYMRTSTAEATKPAVSGQNTYTIIQLSPATIESDLGRVEFYPDSTSTRQDISGGMALGAIKVFSKQSNKYIAYYKFQHAYSTAVNSSSFNTDPTYNYRLKLMGMQQLSVLDSSVQKTWTFQYNPNSLPGRHSYAQDHWGYYNGATNNTNFMPGNVEFSPTMYPWANRDPDSISMMAEMLTRINYPTGGYSSFAYEPNSYPIYGPLYGPNSDYINLYLTANQTNYKYTQTDTLHIPSMQYFTYQFEGIFSSEYMQDYASTTPLALATLKDSLGNTITTGSKVLKKTDNQITYTITVLLNPGTYTLTVNSIETSSANFGDLNDNVDLMCNYGYYGITGYGTYNKWVGGVRVQSIVDNDSVAGNVNQRYFKYGNALVLNPIDSTSYLTEQTENSYGLGGLSGQASYWIRSSALKFGLGDIQGGTVAYGTVLTQYGPNGANGYSLSQFTNPNDWNVPSAMGFPYPYASSRDFERGLPLQQTDYTAAGQPVKQVTNTYTFVPQGSITAFKAAFTNMMDGGPFTYTTLGQILTRQFYTNNTEEIQKTSTTEKTYNTATGDSLSVTTYYYYDNPANTNPTRTVSLNSKLDTVVSYRRTALEQADINSSIPLTATAIAALDTMVARNIVGTPVESEKYTKGVLTSKALTNYKVQGSGWVLPDNVMLQNAANALETRIYFSKYDPHGNLLEQLKAADEKHDYVWDYQSTYPVAEVLNGDSLSVAYTSFEADGSGNWTISSSARDSTTVAITGRKSYPIGNGAISIGGLSAARTYIVSYWSTAGSYTVGGSGSLKTGKTVGAWTYYEHTVTGVTAVSVSGSGGNIDELRLYPQGAQMTTYTYEPLVGITTQCDLNNRVTYYLYDGMERLWLVKDQDRNILKEICYNYFGVPASCGTKYYYNVLTSGTFTRNNCAAGGTGGSVTYTVPAGRYVSALSQADANQQASADVAANGQTYANSNGSCTFYNVATSGTFTSNNCAAGGTPSSVTYTVAAGTYSSTVSQVAANTLAQNDVNANGQNYANANGTCTFYNVATSGTFTKNNCATGGYGSSVTYTVAAGTYSSTVSQAAANTLAQNGVNANGQNYANANGICTFYNVATSGTFTRTNCGCGYYGGSITYTVAAMTYSSTVSQAAANTLAQNDVNANGQNYANANASCIVYNCVPPSQKLIGCSCQTGTYGIISQTRRGNQCITTYGYIFSDGSSIVTSTTTTTGCP